MEIKESKLSGSTSPLFILLLFLQDVLLHFSSVMPEQYSVVYPEILILFHSANRVCFNNHYKSKKNYKISVRNTKKKKLNYKIYLMLTLKYTNPYYNLNRIYKAIGIIFKS